MGLYCSRVVVKTPDFGRRGHLRYLAISGRKAHKNAPHLRIWYACLTSETSKGNRISTALRKIPPSANKVRLCSCDRLTPGRFIAILKTPIVNVGASDFPSTWIRKR